VIAGWLVGFVIQAVVRNMLSGTSPIPSLAPMTGVAFVLFTFYMVPDPATTPERPSAQLAFGAAVATVYGLLVAVHIPCALFFSLTVVCALRGAGMWAMARVAEPPPVVRIETAIGD
jgi:hypothetical protein